VETRSYLKKIFWPNLGGGSEIRILEILEYSSVSNGAPALTLNQNPIFEIASKAFMILLIIGTTLLPCQPLLAGSSQDTDIEELLEGFTNETPVEDSETVPELLEGFEEEGPAAATKQAADTGTARVGFDGYLQLWSAINYAHAPPQPGQTDWRGLSSLRTEFLLEMNARLTDDWRALVSGSGFYDLAYVLNGRDHFTEQVLQAYEKELELREAFVQGSVTKALDLKAGRQIAVWGKSDYIRVTDVLNPLDLREPGLTDLEDLRLPVTMTRADYYFGDWSVTGIAVHEIRFNKNPVFGSDFYPYPTPLPPETIPTTSWDNTEWALAVNGVFSQWDIAFYHARLYNDQPHTVLTTPVPIPRVNLQHAPITMYGSAAQAALGNWLLKAEMAYFEDLQFFNAPTETFHRLDASAGLEYSGFHETIISLDIANRHLDNWSLAVAAAPDFVIEDDFQSVIGLSREFLDDTLELAVIASTFGVTGQNGAFQRYTADYDINDDLAILVGLIDYQSGDKEELKQIGENDRIYFRLRYSF